VGGGGATPGFHRRYMGGGGGNPLVPQALYGIWGQRQLRSAKRVALDASAPLTGRSSTLSLAACRVPSAEQLRGRRPAARGQGGVRAELPLPPHTPQHAASTPHPHPHPAARCQRPSTTAQRPPAPPGGLRAQCPVPFVFCFLCVQAVQGPGPGCVFCFEFSVCVVVLVLLLGAAGCRYVLCSAQCCQSVRTHTHALYAH
jgi:hypothetical protein